MPIAFKPRRGLFWFIDNVSLAFIMTTLFLLRFSKGNNDSLPSTFSEVLSLSSTTSSTPVHSQGGDGIYLWVPLIVVIVFAAIVIVLIVLGRQSQHPACKCLNSSSLDSANQTVLPRPVLTLNIGRTVNPSDPNVPETPPPSYAVIARQISYISQISQTSSQIEIPPGYDEALGIPDGSSKRRSSALSTRGSVSSQGQPSKSSARIRLFSRSPSATDTNRRPPLLRQPSTPSDVRALGLSAGEVVLEHPELGSQELSVVPTTLDIIHETPVFMENTENFENSDVADLPSDSQDHHTSRFYIDDAENENSVT